MRAISIALTVGVTLAAVAPATSQESACRETQPSLEPVRMDAAVTLLGSMTQLGAPLGQSVLASNFATTVAINNQATWPARAQAIVDTYITNDNANILADGLGATMARAYRAQAFVRSKDDGAASTCGEVGPAVTALIRAANDASATDSQTGKYGYASGAKKLFRLPPGGTYDVLGIAYGHPAGSPGANHFGNSRPFQTAPLWATSGPRIHAYNGVDFFGVPTNSWALLAGTTKADEANGLTGSDLTNSPSYPSGHTTFGYTEALTLAMMVPERLQALAYRGSEYGNSRIVVGAHYAIDVIAGRTLATYDLAHALAGSKGWATVSGGSFRKGMIAAAAELRGFLEQKGCASLTACAADPIVRANQAAIFVDGKTRAASPREAYAFRLNYGLTPMGPTNLPPEPVPAEAGHLLDTRFPYLTSAQRLEILRTTEGPSGHFLDVSPLDGAPLFEGKGAESEAGVYSRLNLFAAAGGYGFFGDQVTVDLDPSAIADPDLQLFDDLARSDTWSNDIAGPGGLTKRGSGTLTLTGNNNYRGPTVVGKGTLEVAGSIRSATRVEAGGLLAGGGWVDDVVVAKGGAIAGGGVDGGGSLDIGGDLAMNADTVFWVRSLAKDTALTRVRGRAMLDGTSVVISLREKPKAGVRYTILQAQDGLSGTFSSVTTDAPDLQPKLSYDEQAVYLTFEAKNAPQAPN